MTKIRQNGGFVGKINNTTTSGASGIFGPNELQYRRLGGLWPNVTATAAAQIPDEYFEYTTLLLPGNGTNGAQNNTFLDGSTNNFTITRNGNTTQGTFSPFSQTGWGNYFDGNGDYLSLANNAAFDFGSGDFTIDCWFYLTGDASANNDGIRSANVLSAFPNSAALSTDYSLGIAGNSSTTGTGIGFNRRASGTSTTLTYTATITKNVWHYVCVVRSGSTLTLYYDGSQVAQNTSFTGNVDTGGNPFKIGGTAWFPSGLNYGQYFPGYISALKVVKGVANTPSGVPTSPPTQSTGTSLLTCQYNRFIDNSTNNFTITRNGDTRVVAFSPFNPTASWSAATYGGSGYFDGSGDYLTVPDDASWDLSASTGSIELFVYPPVAATNTPGLIGQCPTTANWSTYIYSDGRIAIGIQGVSELATAAGSLIVNAMNHIVITRDSGTSRTRLFVNGILKATGTGTYFNNSSASLHIGYFNGYAFNGYIAEIRFCKGSIPTTYQTSSTTVGDSIFTPPSAPITTSSQGATSGDVKLLLNFTNAGIYDATSKNDLETVGNAQISTAISAKWGSGSMYFDGTNSSLSALRGDLFAYGTGNFTIESWLYPTAFSNYKTIYSGYVSSSSAAGFELGSDATGALYIYSGGAFGISATSATLTINSWNHVAMVRNGSTITIYINGTSRGTWSLTTQNFTDNYCSIGKTGTGSSQYFSGYMQDFRITKGYARYTANFTAPTAAFPTL